MGAPKEHVIITMYVMVMMILLFSVFHLFSGDYLNGLVFVYLGFNIIITYVFKEKFIFSVINTILIALIFPRSEHMSLLVGIALMLGGLLKLVLA